jgi:tyrosyl-tRNA synthetase
MAETLSLEQQMELITANLQEVLNKEIMEEVMKKGEPLRIYWGTATTGRPHCGYVCSIPSPYPIQFCDCNIIQLHKITSK